MGTQTECHVKVGLTPENELIGFLEVFLVAVAGSPILASNRHRMTNRAENRRIGRRQSNSFFDGIEAAFRMGNQFNPQSGIALHVFQQHAKSTVGRVKATDKEERDHGHYRLV